MIFVYRVFCDSFLVKGGFSIFFWWKGEHFGTKKEPRHQLEVTSCSHTAPPCILHPTVISSLPPTKQGFCCLQGCGALLFSYNSGVLVTVELMLQSEFHCCGPLATKRPNSHLASNCTWRRHENSSRQEAVKDTSCVIISLPQLRILKALLCTSLPLGRYCLVWATCWAMTDSLGLSPAWHPVP